MLHYESYQGQTKFFSPSCLLYLFQLSSEYVLKQEFKPKYALFFSENSKILPALGALPADLYVSGGWKLILNANPHIGHISFRFSGCTLAHKGAFTQAH